MNHEIYCDDDHSDTTCTYIPEDNDQHEEEWVLTDASMFSFIGQGTLSFT